MQMQLTWMFVHIFDKETKQNLAMKSCLQEKWWCLIGKLASSLRAAMLTAWIIKSLYKKCLQMTHCRDCHHQ